MSSSRGRLFVIAGPSGAGKTTLARHLLDSFDDAVFSVSCTTRPPRGSEREGVDYSFISGEEFLRRLEEGYFLEHATVHGNLYGTSREMADLELDRGRSVILDIDVQGALQVRDAFPLSVLVFVLPPGPDVLAARLAGRNTDDEDTIRKRMETAAWETSWIGCFDFFVRNGDLEEAKRQIASIYTSERLRLDGAVFPREAAALFPAELFAGLQRWRGCRVVVTSGPTREPMDSVRYVSNRSSGLMGRCMAEAFLDAGSEVVYVTGPSRLLPPAGARTVRVVTAAEMLEALLDETEGADLLVMAAAVSDFAPARTVAGKMERGGSITVDMEPTPDILRTLQRKKDGLCPVLAFALEFGPGGWERASLKMRAKGAAAVFLNPGDDPETGMERPFSTGTLIFPDGSSKEIPRASKRHAARLMVSLLGEHLGEGGRS